MAFQRLAICFVHRPAPWRTISSIVTRVYWDKEGSLSLHMCKPAPWGDKGLNALFDIAFALHCGMNLIIQEYKNHLDSYAQGVNLPIFPVLHPTELQGPKTNVLTSILSRPSASGRVLGSSKAVCANLPPFTAECSFNASLSKHSRRSLSEPVIPLK